MTTKDQCKQHMGIQQGEEGFNKTLLIFSRNNKLKCFKRLLVYSEGLVVILKRNGLQVSVRRPRH